MEPFEPPKYLEKLIVALNDGAKWKGEPNASLSGQPIPLPPRVAEMPAIVPPGVSAYVAAQ